MFDLNNKIALVTGASGGIGAEVATALHAQGATVVLHGTRASKLEALRAELGERAVVVTANLANRDDVADLVESASEAAGGPLNILVNNAGTSQRGDFLDISDALWQEDLDLKLFAAIRLSRLVIPGMRTRQWGRIINVLNLGAKAPAGGSAPTAISRAAGMALMKVLASENAAYNVLVNGLLVGRIESEQWERRHAADARQLSLEDWYAEAAEQLGISMGRFGTAQEFANIATFLASDAGSYINGTAINVDGGLSPVV